MSLPVVVVETGLGLSNANSYASYAEAQEYVSSIPAAYKQAWPTAEYEISQLLIFATRTIDNFVYFPCCTQLSQFQALMFPLVGLVDQFGVAVNANPLPLFIKQATIQFAYELSKADLLQEPTRGISAATVGPLQVTFDTRQQNQRRVIPQSVASIVLPFGGVVRGTPGIRSVPMYRA